MNTITSAAAAINEEHLLARRCAESAIQHAIRCGELLQAQKTALPHGEFMRWVAANCEFQYSTAARYMKAASQSSTGVEISTLSEIFLSGRKKPHEALAGTGEYIDGADPYFRQEWVDRIPIEPGMVTLGCVDSTLKMMLIESKLNPGFWHDFDLSDSTSSIRPCKPDALRWRLMSDPSLASVTWRTGPDSGDWLEAESEYWKQSSWWQRAQRSKPTNKLENA